MKAMMKQTVLYETARYDRLLPAADAAAVDA